MRQKYYITTAIAYASGKPHIGNTYEAILALSLSVTICLFSKSKFISVL